MELPKKLVNEFAKVTNDSEAPKTETTVYGTIVKNGDSVYAKFDGSDLTTPVSTTTDIEDGDRVTVLVKDHTAVVTGNMTSPSARTDDVQAMDEKFDAEIGSLKVDKLSADEAKITYATIENLEANYATIKNLEATDAKIDKLAATDFDAKYANIDFANIGEAAVKKLFSESGIIKDLVVSGGQITGELVGVTIKGDLIEGNTVVADKLVVKGEDGLFYKLNVDGMTQEVQAEQTEYNSLNGSIITAKSITATKIAVDDLVAFDATIGGFKIGSNAIYSDVKASIDNTTQGIYLGKDGQFAVGDGNNYLKYYKTSNGTYKLVLAFGGDDIQTAITDATNTANDAATDAAIAESKANSALSEAYDAAKTATNFLEFSNSNGLQIGNKSAGSWSGYRTQITSSEFNILNSSGTEVASYGTNLIKLGKNSINSEVSFCSGKGKISYVSDRYGNGLQFSSDRLDLKSDNITLSSSTTTSSGVERTWFYVGADSIIASVLSSTSSGATSGAPYFQMMNNGSNNSIRLEAGDTIIISAPTVQDTNGREFLSVTRGSSGTWEYKKWSNGDVELWGYQTVTSTSCSTAVGSMYRTVEYAPPSFPFTVYSPNLTAFYESDSGGYGGFYWPTSNTTTLKPPTYYIMRPNRATIHGKVNFHVYGKWE